MNVFKKIAVTVLLFSLIFSAMLTFSSCATEKIEIESSVKYLSEADYLSGSFDDKLRDSLDLAIDEKGYAVIDYTLYGNKNLDKEISLRIQLYSNDGALFQVGVEELPSPSFEKRGNIISTSFQVKINGKEGTHLRSIVYVVADAEGKVDISAALNVVNSSSTGIGDATGSINISREIEVESQLEYLLSDDGTYYVVSGLGKETGENITVASTYNGLPVKEIAERAFANTAYIQSVSILDGVERIGREAFDSCIGLNYILIPTSVNYVGEGAFTECRGLNLYFDPSLDGISWDDRSEYDYLHVIPNAGALFTLNGDGGSYSFSYPSLDFRTLHIPETYKKLPVTAISKNAFKGNASLINVSIPRHVTKIGEMAFYGCINLREISLPKGVTQIDKYTFYGCTSLRTVEMGNYVNSIGDFAFHSCTSLEAVKVSNELTTIGKYAFNGCRSLISFTVPSTVTLIDVEAFYGCCKLVEIVNNSRLSISEGDSENGGIALYALDVTGNRSGIENANGYLFLSSDGENYLIGYTEEDTGLVLPSSFNGEEYRIYDYAFYYKEITNVQIPKAVVGIGDYAFYQTYGISISYDGTANEFWEIPKDRYWINENAYNTYTYNNGR